MNTDGTGLTQLFRDSDNGDANIRVYYDLTIDETNQRLIASGVRRSAINPEDSRLGDQIVQAIDTTSGAASIIYSTPITEDTSDAFARNAIDYNEATSTLYSGSSVHGEVVATNLVDSTIDVFGLYKISDGQRLASADNIAKLDNQYLVSFNSFLEQITQINSQTGEQIRLFDDINLNTKPESRLSHSLFDITQNRLLVERLSLDTAELIAIDLTTGDNTVLAEGFNFIFGDLALDKQNNIAYTYPSINQETTGLMAINLDNGNVNNVIDASAWNAFRSLNTVRDIIWHDQLYIVSTDRRDNNILRVHTLENDNEELVLLTEIDTGSRLFFNLFFMPTDKENMLLIADTRLGTIYAIDTTNGTDTIAVDGSQVSGINLNLANPISLLGNQSLFDEQTNKYFYYSTLPAAIVALDGETSQAAIIAK